MTFLHFSPGILVPKIVFKFQISYQIATKAIEYGEASMHRPLWK